MFSDVIYTLCWLVLGIFWCHLHTVLPGDQSVDDDLPWILALRWRIHKGCLKSSVAPAKSDPEIPWTAENRVLWQKERGVPHLACALATVESKPCACTHVSEQLCVLLLPPAEWVGQPGGVAATGPGGLSCRVKYSVWSHNMVYSTLIPSVPMGMVGGDGRISKEGGELPVVVILLRLRFILFTLTFI